MLDDEALPERKDEMTNEMKIKLFEKMLELEHLGETTTYDGRDYVEQSNGAWKMLVALGIEREYIHWSIGK